MKIKYVLIGLILLGLSLCSVAHEKNSIKIAMAQLFVEGGKPEANLDRAVKCIEEAKNNDADIIILPETIDFGWTHTSAKTYAGPIPGSIAYSSLAKAAEKYNIYVCAGIVERAGGQLYNSAVLISPKGKLILRHRKINEVGPGLDLYDIGTEISVAETELGTIGLLVCADAIAKDYLLTHAVGYLGADLILLPCSWAVSPSHDNRINPYGGIWINAFTPICKEYKLNIVGVSNVGKVTDGDWKGWYCIGNSIFMSNTGEVVTLPYGKDADTIVYQQISKEH